MKVRKQHQNKTPKRPHPTKLPKVNAIFNLRLFVSTGYSISTNIYPFIFKQKAGVI